MPITANMNGHRFRLERVRALRERREEAAKLEFAGALQRRAQCEAELALAEARIADARRTQLQPSPSLTATDLRDRQAYLERVERAQQLVREDLNRHEVELEDRRTALTQASQDRQALERLKERSLANHVRELARVEQNTLDEIAGNGHRRRAA